LLPTLIKSSKKKSCVSMNWDLFTPKRKDGEHVSRYGKGQLREKRGYLKGKLNGTYESYYENGQLIVRMPDRKIRSVEERIKTKE
jgi:hypothetical protein